jgi:hypothetical protein
LSCRIDASVIGCGTKECQVANHVHNIVRRTTTAIQCYRKITFVADGITTPEWSKTRANTTLKRKEVIVDIIERIAKEDTVAVLRAHLGPTKSLLCTLVDAADIVDLIIAIRVQHAGPTRRTARITHEDHTQIEITAIVSA